MQYHLLNIRKNIHRGMTVMELVVVISIFGIMATVILSNFKSFTNKITVQNIAHDVALRIVEAQRSAASGKLGALLFVPDGYRPRYGIFADVTANKLTLFIDAPVSGGSAGNYVYDTTNSCPSVECISELTFQNSYNLTTITGTVGTASPVTLTSAYIVFERPSLQAALYGYTNSAQGGLGTSYDEVDIGLSAPTGETATIRVYHAGQVVVE
jgi:prepilin-type N-terminal cleavage/methylation domain-containing protein